MVLMVVSDIVVSPVLVVEWVAIEPESSLSPLALCTGLRVEVSQGLAQLRGQRECLPAFDFGVVRNRLAESLTSFRCDTAFWGPLFDRGCQGVKLFYERLIV